MCFLVLERQGDDLFDLQESLKKYVDRHIQKDNPYYRYHQFCSLLLNVPKCNFNRTLVAENTADLLENLQSAPYDPVKSAYRGEVINLEEVWDLLLEEFDRCQRNDE